jgi:RNA polymerase sigma-70 factor (sigma-E family)
VIVPVTYETVTARIVAASVADMTLETQDFEAFVRQWLPAHLRYATALSGDPHLAADIVQDVLVRAHSRWRNIRGADRPDLYVKRMITNEYLSWRRRWHVRNVVPASLAVLHARHPITADAAQQIVDRDDLLHRLAKLPRRQRAVLVLRFYEGLSDREIAEILGVAPGTVRSTASRALAALRPAPLTSGSSDDT